MKATPRRSVRRDQDQPPVDPVDVDAGDRREEDGRHEEAQDQQADRRVRAGRADDDRRSARRAPCCRRSGSPPGPARGGGTRRCGRRPAPLRSARSAPRVPAQPRRVTSVIAPGSPDRAFQRGGHGGVTAGDEADQPALDASPLDEHVTGAALAAEADVRAEAIDQPGRRPRTDAVAAGGRRRRGAARGRASLSSGGSGYQRRGWPWPGTRIRRRGSELDPVDRRRRSPRRPDRSPRAGRSRPRNA